MSATLTLPPASDRKTRSPSHSPALTVKRSEWLSEGKCARRLAGKRVVQAANASDFKSNNVNGTNSLTIDTKTLPIATISFLSKSKSLPFATRAIVSQPKDVRSPTRACAPSLSRSPLRPKPRRSIGQIKYIPQLITPPPSPHLTNGNQVVKHLEDFVEPLGEGEEVGREGEGRSSSGATDVEAELERLLVQLAPLDFQQQKGASEGWSASVERIWTESQLLAGPSYPLPAPARLSIASWSRMQKVEEPLAASLILGSEYEEGALEWSTVCAGNEFLMRMRFSSIASIERLTCPNLGPTLVFALAYAPAFLVRHPPPPSPLPTPLPPSAIISSIWSPIHVSDPVPTVFSPLESSTPEEVAISDFTPGSIASLNNLHVVQFATEEELENVCAKMESLGVPVVRSDPWGRGPSECDWEAEADEVEGFVAGHWLWQ